MRSDVRHANNDGGLARARRLGLVVNPVAGMGGPVGLKGTDGAEALARARALGATPVAAGRAARALARLAAGPGLKPLVVAPPGEAGADVARAAGFPLEEIALPGVFEGGAATREAARRLVAAGVDLLVFAGGDGTARDVLDGAPGARALGVPTGVKMQSGVFAATPEAAGDVMRAALSGEGGGVAWREGEVMDLDEDALRAGRVEPRLYGALRVPAERRLMANAKARSFAGDDAALEALAAETVAAMAPGRLYVIGCGTTTARLKRRLGGGTLLGVDVALDGRLLATDVTEARLLRLTQGCETTVIVAATGGGGFLFGRGNQQISPQLLRRVRREDVVVITGAGKLAALDPPLLRVDTGDPALDASLEGYVRVRTAPGQSMMMRVAA